jgi:hypothetical protein
MIGPMSENGFHVGAAYYIIYFETEAHAIQSAASVSEDEYYPDMTNDISYNTYDQFYTIQTINDISTWYIAANTGGTDPTPNGGPYNAEDVLVNTGIYYLYHTPTPPAPPTPTPTFSFSMRSLFTNNAQVYYKRGSLSTGSGGSGVTNSRIKKRRT